jgi:hypothetical protein
MDKTYKIFGIIALVTVIGFSMTACKDSPSVHPNTITVSDIPSDYEGKFGTLLLYPFPITSSTPTVYSMEEYINGTFSLYNWKKDDPWDGTGTFRITFLIYESVEAARIDQYIYSGVFEEGASISITEKNTDIEWSSFIKK